MTSDQHRDPADARRRIDALFDVESPQRRWPRRLAAGVALIAVLGAGAGVASARASGDSSSRYRTATASVADVASTWTGVASIEPVSQAAVAFPTSGTVATVDVNVGDTVSVGTTLATLDTTSLEAALHTSQAALDDANLTLSQALTNKSTAGASTTTTAPAATSESESPNAGNGSNANGGSDLATAQQAVLSAQRSVDAAMATSAAKLAAADHVCADTTADTSPSTTTPTATDTSTTPSTTTPSTPGDDVGACRTALGDVATAQRAVADAQSTLAAAMSKLDSLLTTASSTQRPSATGNSSVESGGRAVGTASPAGTGAPGTGTTTSSPTSADLVSYQRAVDAAELQVAVSEQAVAQATIVSPIAGTVVAFAIKSGDTVSAGSSTQNVTIQGSGGYEATAVVPLSDMTGVAVGNAAQLTPDGTHQVLHGKVVAVAATPNASSSGSSSGSGFRVTVGLTDPAVDTLRNGGTGSLTITTGGATRALSVPTSAVTTRNGRHTVTVLGFDATTSNTSVQVGVVGGERTQITSGLSAGDRVVLADLDQPLPSSATDATGRTSTGNRSGQSGGGFPAPPAGFGGGPPGS